MTDKPPVCPDCGGAKVLVIATAAFLPISSPGWSAGVLFGSSIPLLDKYPAQCNSCEWTGTYADAWIAGQGVSA